MTEFFAREWSYGVGTGHPGSVHVFASDQERERWLWSGEADHKEAVDSKTARLTKVYTWTFHGDAIVPAWMREENRREGGPHWLKEEQWAGLDDCTTYRRFDSEAD